MDITLNIVIGLAVLVVVAGLQLRTREHTPRRARVAAVLTVVGAVHLVSSETATPASALGLSAVAAGLVAGAVLGVARAHTMTVWSEDGRVWTRGTGATAALWAAGFTVHLGLDLLIRLVAPADEPVSAASVLLFVGVTLGAQALAQRQRVAVGA